MPESRSTRAQVDSASTRMCGGSVGSSAAQVPAEAIRVDFGEVHGWRAARGTAPNLWLTVDVARVYLADR